MLVTTPVPTAVRGLAIAVACAVAATTVGCSAPASEPAPSSTPRASAPDGGQLLSDRGIRNGPAGFSIPADIVALRTIDQPNVVTLVVASADGRRLVTYLSEHRDALGLREVVSREGSMTFLVQGWEGAVTTSPELAGLTLRRKP